MRLLSTYPVVEDWRTNAHPADFVQYSDVVEIHARQRRRIEANNDHSKLDDCLRRPGTWTLSKLRLRKYTRQKTVQTPKKSKVNAAICIMHRHEHVSNALPLPVSQR